MMKTLFRPQTLMLAVLAAVAVSGYVRPVAKSQDSAFPRVSLPNTELRQLTSKSTGRDYDIYVKLPNDYAEDQKRNFPVLYVLDGQWDFKMVDSIQGGLLADNYVPRMIIVGISYPGENPNFNALRAMDFTTFTDPSMPGSGDAPHFYSFIKDELIPFIESNYRVDPTRRTLMGSSLGGSFTLYAMFTQPDLFTGYVAGSPAVSFGANGGDTFNQEADYASTHKDLPARVFISVGDIEFLTAPVESFMKVITERNYTGLDLETRVIEGENHASNKPEAYNRGLRFIFQGK